MHSLRRRLTPVALCLSVCLALAGCESVEERAEGHYQSALALIEDGDIDRAIVELRNVFDLNSNHKDARRTMAELLLEKGNRPGAYRQYLRLAEQDPNDLETRIILSEMAFLGGSWDELERHGARVEELDPANPRVEVITLMRSYREAATGGETALRRDLGRKADEMLTGQPDNPLLRNILVDHSIREQDYTRALTEIDWMIAYNPTNSLYYQERLRVLARMDDTAGVEAQLRQLVDIFPEEPTHKATLVRYYISRDNLDAAEGFLRDLVAEAEPDDPGPTLDMIRFLVELRGPAVARAELEKVIGAHSDPVPFLTIAAGLDFNEGQQDKAIATLEDLLDGAEPSDRIRDIKVTLARMLLATDNEVGARARVEEVLAEKDDHPGALKMVAAWQIEAGNPDAAIAGLRTALDQNVDDAEALTLMADAYARLGDIELTRDFLARAVQASGNAPPETLRLADFLMKEESYLPAEDILISALRLEPSNIDILSFLGQLYLEMEDFGRAQSVADALRRIGTDVSLQLANRVEAERINRQRGVQEALAFLEELASAEDATLATRIAFVRAQINAGDNVSALTLAEELVEEMPENEALVLVLAVSHVANGNFDTAMGLYRDVLAQNKARPDIWLELSRLHLRQEDRDRAKDVINEGLGHNPQAANLLAARASFLEQDGAFDEAIAVYEEIYALNSGSVVVANNLASLLTTHRDDEESLERAWAIGRVLRNTEIPALQDTYGWLLHRRGNNAEALPYLEAAAENLPEEPLVQYHLGKVYVALERPDEAVAALRRAIQLAGPADTRPQFTDARAVIQSLQAAAEASDN